MTSPTHNAVATLIAFNTEICSVLQWYLEHPGSPNTPEWQAANARAADILARQPLIADTCVVAPGIPSVAYVEGATARRMERLGHPQQNPYWNGSADLARTDWIAGYRDEATREYLTPKCRFRS